MSSMTVSGAGSTLIVSNDGKHDVDDEKERESICKKQDMGALMRIAEKEWDADWQ